MTAGRFGTVDLDLLADYVGGVLDGTPDEIVVSRLIADDPDWSRAYAELAPAVETVRDSLAAWGAIPALMPADVTDRLTAALATAEPLDPSAPVARGPFKGEVDGDRTAGEVDGEPTTAGPATIPHQVPGPHLVVVPAGKNATGGRDAATRRRRRRWSRLAGPVSVAAAVAALGGFGVSQLLGAGDNAEKASSPNIAGSRPGDSAASTSPNNSAAGRASEQSAAAPAAPRSEEQPRALLDPSAEGLLSSGTDYTAGTISGKVDELGRQAAATKAGPAAAPDRGRQPGPDGLRRLTDRAALAVCLDSVAVEHATGPITVELVDYASFEGNPALVVVFTDRSPARWAWVAGPDCGVPGAAADTRYQGRVG